MNEYSPFNPILLTFFKVSNAFLSEYWAENVSNGVNNSNIYWEIRSKPKKKLTKLG